MLLEYCSECGRKVSDDSINQGAVRVGKNTYICEQCVKAGVLQNVSQKGSDAAPAARSSGTSLPRTTRPPGPSGSGRTNVAKVQSKSKLPLLIAAAGVFILGIGVVTVALKGSDSEKPPSIPAPAPTTLPTATVTPPTDPTPTVTPSVDLTKRSKPDEYDPHAAVAQSQLEQAKAWFKNNADDPENYREKLDKVKTDYARTPAAEEASRIMADLKIPVSAPTDRLQSDAEWKNAFNLLAAVDPAVDTVRGTWTRKDEALVSGAELKKLTTMLALPYVPAEEYDLRLTGMRTTGADSIGLRIPRGEHGVGFVLAGWGNDLAGFERIGGKRASEGPSHYRRSQFLKNGTPFTLVLQVRRKTVKVWFDGKYLVECSAPVRELSAYDRDWGSSYEDRIGVGTWESGYELRRVDLLDHSGKGRMLPLAGRLTEPQRGLWASYFTSGGEPDHFKKFLFSRAERKLHWDIGNGKIDPEIAPDHFDIRYGGFLRIAQAGKYRFHLSVDDVVTLWIDGKEIGKTGAAQSDNHYEVDLTPGDHPIRMDFTEYGGAASMHVQWEPPGKPRSDIPLDVLLYDPTKTGNYREP